MNLKDRSKEKCKDWSASSLACMSVASTLKNAYTSPSFNKRESFAFPFAFNLTDAFSRQKTTLMQARLLALQSFRSKKIFASICVYLWIIFLSFAANAQTKAVWIRPFIGATAEIRGDETKSREFIKNELTKIKRAKINTIFVESLWDGYTIYPSKVTVQRPLSVEYGTARGGAKNFDVLQIYLDEAAKLDLKVHAWLHIFHQWNTNLGGLKNSPIFAKHADWAALDQNNSSNVVSEAEGKNRDIYKVFLSPSNAQARQFLQNIVREMAEKYPRLAGAQWDYIRYPLHDNKQNFDFSADALRQFAKEAKLDARNLKSDAERQVWQDWKTKQVTETVESFNRIIRKTRPNWEISVAVFPGFEHTLKVKMQDSRTWAKNGWINAIYPMLYSTNFATVDAWASEFRREIPPATKVNAAFYVSHFYDAKTRKIDERYLEIPSKYKYDGTAYFAAQLLTDDLIEQLGK